MTEPIFDHDRLDVLFASGGMNRQSSDELKRTLKRIVSMLTRMAMKFDGVADSPVEYARGIDYEHEHRDAEHEHDWCAEPEPSRPRADWKWFDD